MAQMTEEMKDVAAKARLFAIATATPEGKPNVVPISFARIISDDEWLLMDNFMEKTEANLKVNPQVAISCWDVNWETLEARGYQFKGNVRFETSGKNYEEGCRWVKMLFPDHQSKAAIIVKVTEIFNLEPHDKK